jgi:hypothetical protein
MVFALHGLLTQRWLLVGKRLHTNTETQHRKQKSEDLKYAATGGWSLANPNMFRPDKIITLPDLC